MMVDELRLEFLKNQSALQNILTASFAKQEELLSNYLQSEALRYDGGRSKRYASSSDAAPLVAHGTSEREEAPAASDASDMFWSRTAYRPTRTSCGSNRTTQTTTIQRRPNTLFSANGDALYADQAGTNKAVVGTRKGKRRAAGIMLALDTKIHNLKGREHLWEMSLARNCYVWIQSRIEWWMALQEPERRGFLADLLENGRFSALSITVILSNSVVELLSTNQRAELLSNEPTTEYQQIDLGFCAFYIVEIMLRMTVHRAYFFCNSDMEWNVFDLVITALGLGEHIYKWTSNTAAGGTSSATSLRQVRTFRIMKMLRVIRVLRFFDDLRAVSSSLVGSVMTLIWSILMMVILFFLLGVFFVQKATDYRADNKSNSAEQQNIHDMRELFGNVQRAMLTLYMATCGGKDWNDVLVTVNLLGPESVACFLFFIAFFEIALFNILTAIFIDKAMKLALPSYESLLRTQEEQNVEDRATLMDLFQTLDADQNGYIDREEFLQEVSSYNSKLLMAFRLLGIDIRNAKTFFATMESISENRRVRIDAFVDTCLKLKGKATSLDLQILSVEVKQGQKFCNQALEQLLLKLDSLSSLAYNRWTAPPVFQEKTFEERLLQKMGSHIGSVVSSGIVSRGGSILDTQSGTFTEPPVYGSGEDYDDAPVSNKMAI